MNYLEFTVVGTEGVLSREWDAEGVVAWIDSGLTDWGVEDSGGGTFVREIESFAAAVGGRGSVVPPVRAAAHAVEIAVASENSLATGRTVLIGEAP
jgi:predicted dehydrogenase